MESSAINVKKTLNALKSVLKEEEGNNINEILHEIMKTSNALTTSQNYGDTMSKVKDLTKITSKLIKALEKEIAQEQDPEYKVSWMSSIILMNDILYVLLYIWSILTMKSFVRLVTIHKESN